MCRHMQDFKITKDTQEGTQKDGSWLASLKSYGKVHGKGTQLLEKMLYLWLKETKNDGLGIYRVISRILIPRKFMEQVLLESMKEKKIIWITQHRFTKEYINMNLLESPQRQIVRPAPEIQQYSLGPSWPERPTCKSRPGGSGGQHVEHELAELLAVRRVPHKAEHGQQLERSNYPSLRLSHISLVKSPP